MMNNKRKVTGVDLLPITKMEELEIVNDSIKEMEKQEEVEKAEEKTAVRQQKLLIEIVSDEKDECVATTEYFGKVYTSSKGEIEDCVSNLFLQIKGDLSKDEMQKTIAFLEANKKNAENMAINIHHLFVEGWFSITSLKQKLAVSEDDAKFKILFLKSYGYISEEKTKTKVTRYKINYNNQLRKIHLENEISTMETNIQLYKAQIEQLSV